MLSYSACAEFYKCPFAYHLRDTEEVMRIQTKAMELGSNVDYMLNVLMLKHIKDKDFREQRAADIGVKEMGLLMAENNDLCAMFDVPEMVKQWYIDFLNSGYEVVDVQPHFVIEELDYHGYADALFKLDDQLVVIENKTTGRYYDKFFAAKKNSMQAVGYALGFGASIIRYQFFNTRNMTEYASVSRFVTPEMIDEFKQWVLFVKNNETSTVRNTEWCSNHDCFWKEICDERY